MTDKPVGASALELQQKTDEKITPLELQQSIHAGDNSKKSYEEEVWETVDRGRKDSNIEGDFYIVVLVKKERHLQNIVRNYFLYRQSCPTPNYDQTVYKYIRKDDELEYLWTVPDNVTCLNLPIHEANLPDDQKLLLSMIKSFRNGDLDKLCAIHNKEVVN